MQKSKRRDHLPDEYKPFDYSKPLPTISDEETSDDKNSFNTLTVFDPEIIIENETHSRFKPSKKTLFDETYTVMSEEEIEKMFNSIGENKDEFFTPKFCV